MFICWHSIIAGAIPGGQTCENAALEVIYRRNDMTADSDDIDAELSLIFEGPPKSPPTMAATTEAQRKEVNAGTARLRQAGYCINIVRPATKVRPLAPGAKHCILCIEDDVPLVQILARKLALDGYAVRTASDRATIVAELQRLPSPDLVLLDVGLPGISGFDLLEKLRKHPKLGSTPVILLTGRISPQDVLHGMTSGADGYVSKPFQFDALAVAIKTVLGMQ
jgi:two-component system OmpR family response regulator